MPSSSHSVKRGFKESQIHLTSTFHIIKITIVEMKQAECLCSLVLQPAFGHSYSQVVSGEPGVRRAFSRASVGLETGPRVVKPEPELLLVLTGGLGGLIPTKLNFSNLFCAGKITDLSLSPCLSKSLSFRYHIYSWK